MSSAHDRGDSEALPSGRAPTDDLASDAGRRDHRRHHVHHHAWEGLVRPAAFVDMFERVDQALNLLELVSRFERRAVSSRLAIRCVAVLWSGARGRRKRFRPCGITRAESYCGVAAAHVGRAHAAWSVRSRVRRATRKYTTPQQHLQHVFRSAYVDRGAGSVSPSAAARNGNGLPPLRPPVTGHKAWIPRSFRSCAWSRLHIV